MESRCIECPRPDAAEFLRRLCAVSATVAVKKLLTAKRAKKPLGHRKTRSRMLSREFLHCPIGLIDGDIRVRRSPRIRVGDGDLSKLLAPEDPGLLTFCPLRVEQ